MDGPVSLIGGCALVDAVWTAVGEDPLTDVYGVLVPALDAAVSGLDGQVAADAIIGASRLKNPASPSVPATAALR